MMNLSFPEELDKIEGHERIIMAKYYLNIEHTAFVDAAFGSGDTGLPKEGIVIGDGSYRYTPQVFLAEVGYLTMDAP
jgi:hypothetical protein